MPHDIIQSAIAEVRDQISLDFSDKKYLNVATGNLGLPRPAFGFTDSLWRAVVKELAIEHKQIRKKFYDIMSILFGPAKTWCGSLKVAALIGAEEVVLNSVDHLPQVGTLILWDEVSATEETIGYHFIDRYTNTVYLNTPLTRAHRAFEWDVELPLIYDVASGSTDVALTYSNYFPITFTAPLRAILSRGQPNEETILISAHTVATNKLTTTAATKLHGGMVPGVVRSALSGLYQTHSVYLSVDDTRKFPPAGYVMLGASSTTFTATAGTVTTVTVAAPSFTGNKLVGFKIKFTGNVTAALAGIEQFITGNSTTVLTLKTLSVAPAAGDTFTVRPILEYTSNDAEDRTLQLRREIPKELKFSAGTLVELLEVRGTITFAPVRSPGTGWDVIQVEPRHIELLIPEAINDEANLRSASYLHASVTSIAGVTVAANASIGARELVVNNTNALTVAGCLILNDGGANAERVAYGLKWTSSVISAVAKVVVGNITTTQITLTTGGLVANGLSSKYVFIDGYGHLVKSNTATTITFTSPLPKYVLNAIVTGVTVVSFFSTNTVILPDGLIAAHSIGESVGRWNPAHAGTIIASGNLYTVADVFPGPYVYEDETVCVAGTAGPTTTLTQTLAKATKCVVERTVGMTAVEVEDAAGFLLSGFPYTALMGRGTGNRETINVNDVNLKQRVGNTIVLTAAVAASPTAPVVLTVASTVASALNGHLPNATRYRILVDRGDVISEEVLVVTATTATTITVESSQKAHAIGETVELMADVLTVDTLNDDHRGYVELEWNASRWPAITSTLMSQAETVEMLYSAVTVANTVGFPASGTAVLNFGQQRMSASTKVIPAGLAAGVTALAVVNSNSFPTVYPYKVVVGLGRAREEVVTVTNNNTTTDVLTISHITKFAHTATDVVSFVTGQSEVLEYTSLTAGAPGTLRFSTPVVVQYDHHAGEDVKVALTDSEPRSLGYDFPLRMPPDIMFRVGFLFDLIRAAGVKLSVIHKR